MWQDIVTVESAWSDFNYGNNSLLTPSEYTILFNSTFLCNMPTCLKMLVMRFADVQWPAPLSLQSMLKAQYKCQVIIIIISMMLRSVCLAAVNQELFHTRLGRSIHSATRRWVRYTALAGRVQEGIDSE